MATVTTPPKSPAPHVVMDGDGDGEDGEAQTLAALVGANPKTEDDMPSFMHSVGTDLVDSVSGATATSAEVIASGAANTATAIGTGAHYTVASVGTGAQAVGTFFTDFFGGVFVKVKGEQASAEDESAWRDSKGEGIGSPPANNTGATTTTTTTTSTGAGMSAPSTEKWVHATNSSSATTSPAAASPGISLSFGVWRTPEKIDPEDEVKPSGPLAETANRRGSETETWHDVQTPLPKP